MLQKAEKAIGAVEILIDYVKIEECERKLESLLERIDTIRQNELVMDESKGEMAEAVLEQYGQLCSVLDAMYILIHKVLKNVKEGKAEFRRQDSALKREFSGRT